MAAEAAGGEGEQQSNRNLVGWGIYDRLKKVPRLTASKDVVSPRGRRMDQSESAAETAARRMVEDLFKQEADAAEPLGDFSLIECNEFTHRKHKKQEEAEITICECVIEEDNPESPCGDQCLNMMTCTECTPGYCPSKELCRNQRFQRCQYAQTKLVKTENRGWGLETTQGLKVIDFDARNFKETPSKAGDFVIEYCGEVIPVREALHRAKGYDTAGSANWYMVNLNGSEYIDGTHSGNMARFINHSCDPNCEAIKWTVLGEDRIGIFAIKDICAGTELTYDYKSTWFGAARMRCNCGANSCAGYFGTRSKAFQIYMREGAPFGKDAYAWEDDAQRTDAEEARQSDDAEDDAPLSSFLDPSLVGRKIRTGVIINAKNAGIIIKATSERSFSSAGTETAVRKETSVSAEIHSTPVAGPSYTLAEKSTPVRRRASVFKRDKLKSLHVLGRFKESSEPKAKKAKMLVKVTKSEEDEEKEEQDLSHSKRRLRSDADDQSKGEVILSAEQPLSENPGRVVGFQKARTVVNKLLLAEFPSWYPVSEAACAEVEFAQEMEIAAASDLRKVCDDIEYPVKDYNSREEPTAEDIASRMNIEENFVEARCKYLRSSLNFHYLIIRHLAGPTFALCSTKEVPASS